MLAVVLWGAVACDEAGDDGDGPPPADPYHTVRSGGREPDWGRNDRLVYHASQPRAMGTVLYSNDRTGGSETPLYVTDSVYVSAPAWSPDCSRIAFCDRNAAGFYQIYVLEVGGETPVLVTKEDGAMPAWSPDGSRIAYVASPSHYGWTGDVWVVTVATGETQRLTTGVETINPSWKPDGSGVTYGDGYGVHVVDLEGHVTTLFTLEGREPESPAWAPGGARVAFSVGAGDDCDICVWEAATGEVTPLTASMWDCRAPTWSPTGDAVAFQGYPYPNATPGVYYMVWPPE